MDFSSWARKHLLKKPNDAAAATATTTGRLRRRESKEEEEELGLTDELREVVKSFTIDTFKSFPLQANGRRDTPCYSSHKSRASWEYRRFVIFLYHLEYIFNKHEISQLRYALCPRHLKDTEFWRIYFLLVKCLVSPYELRAIREEKLKRLERQEEKSPNKVFEVEMSEAKQETIGSSTDLPV
ncbi:hypothetical protein Scep_029063 [Stephania cephalantha]|uniref:BSD domain-containing protein n=1 Tax=Stephania cephalantha TaxID=152367 RepID=A0AAP0E1E3_9MAGN